MLYVVLIICNLFFINLFAQQYPSAPTGAIVEVVYPRDKDEKGYYHLEKGIDSTFLLGNVISPKETKLFINGTPINIDSGGGWLAWLKCPSSKKDFTWHIQAIYQNDTVHLKLPVKRSIAERPSSAVNQLKIPIWVKTKNNARLQLDPGGQNVILPMDGTVLEVFQTSGNYYATKTYPQAILWFHKDNTQRIETPEQFRIQFLELYFDSTQSNLYLKFQITSLPLFYLYSDSIHFNQFYLNFYSTYLETNNQIQGLSWLNVTLRQSPTTNQFCFTIRDQTKWIGYHAKVDSNLLILTLRFSPKNKVDTIPNYPLRGWKICIDPGHGGEQYGAIGPTWISEKNVNLKVANLLKRKLIHLGAEVVQTRENDTTLTLSERVQIAERTNAHMLVSIHQNAVPDNQNPWMYNGSTTYYFHTFAKPLGNHIHKSLIKELALSDEGLYVGDFAVTRFTGALSILTEATFIIRPDHERLLKSPSFLNLQAEAIAKGIVNYVQSIYE
ncbi:MAG: N-acetylmuramoyl-L-alanine amidase [bacterium]|nr:N-acetylmuramoyl-L-alanine amidase [bacterium]